MIERIAMLEKIKNPIIAGIVGMAIGSILTWQAIDKYYGIQIKTHETTISSLQQQLYDKNKFIAEKEAEIQKLYSKLTVNQVNSVSKVGDRYELKKLIIKLDNEIEQKKLDFVNNSPIAFVSKDNQNKKSDSYLRIEKELEDVQKQRALARQRLIESLAR